jgi:hypothetical protein
MLFHELRIEKRRYINKIKGKLYLNAQKEIFASSHVAAGSQFLFGPFSATEPHQSLIDPFVNWHLQIAFPARSHHESGARALAPPTPLNLTRTLGDQKCISTL